MTLPLDRAGPARPGGAQKRPGQVIARVLTRVTGRLQLQTRRVRVKVQLQYRELVGREAEAAIGIILGLADMLYNILAAFVTWTQVRVTFTVSVLPLGRGGRSSLSRGRTWRCVHIHDHK